LYSRLGYIFKTRYNKVVNKKEKLVEKSKSCDNKTVEIDGVKYKLKAI